MKRCAIYARRSTEEHQAASLATQRESAELFARERGWTVVETFEDSGISGSEFIERPGLRALKAFCVRGGCDVVLVRALDRVGRDTLRAVEFVRDLGEAGIELWTYATGSQVKADEPVSIFTAMAVSLAGDLEARALRSRITEGLKRRAEKGLCVGGEVYGYRRERTPEGVRYVIDEAQAAVVRELFTRRADGASVRELVHALNDRRVPSPSAGRRGTGSWSPSAVHAILERERYRGVLAWGRSGSAYKGGTRKAIVRADHEVTRVERPELAIVDAETWERVRARDVPEGGHGGGNTARHLLIGHARCARCGGPLATVGRRQGAVTVPAYACAWAKDRGRSVCDVTLRRPAASVDAVVIGWMEREALGAERERYVVELVRAAIERTHATPDTRREELEREYSAVKRERERLVKALALVDDPSEVAREIKVRDVRLRALRAEIDLFTQRAVLAPWTAIETRVRALFGELRTLLSANMDGARKVLAALLDGERITAEAVGEGRDRAWLLRGAVRVVGVAGLGAASMPPASWMASLEGTEQTRHARASDQLREGREILALRAA